MSVWLVGAGCGPPGFLTVAAAECIRGADDIVYDRLIHPDLLQLAPSGCHFHLVGKRENAHTLTQDGINELLVELARARENGVIVRLKGGDPFVFGRGGEEAEFLERNGISWKAVPGVTSALGGAVDAGIPVTHREDASSLILATGHRRHMEDTRDDYYWKELAQARGTVALYMGTSNFSAVAERLLRFGRPPHTPVSVVTWGGWGRAARVDGTLAGMAERAARGEIPSPSMIYIGAAVSRTLRPDRGPLAGMQLVICRPYPECWETGRALEKLSADCYGLPLLSAENIDFGHAAEELMNADWLVVTSPRGVARLRELARDVRRIKGRVVSIGAGTTSALAAMGIMPELEAGGDSVSLADLLTRHVRGGEIVVFARNERGADAPVSAAENAGARVVVTPTYRMNPREVPGIEVMKEQWETCGVDAVVFGSSALAEVYARVIGAPPPSAALVAWGRACGAAVGKLFGVTPVVMNTPDLSGLIEALILSKLPGSKPRALPEPGREIAPCTLL
ncbi:MAG: uroporphyrinogen-III C-methyltransferase [Synergistaceae bacterium]|jgi:uroporphyrinogen III methyltransferase/synthase|nr:uroporphyrinogen-III C-methyltransferase [Synergistaceae bacterium]